MQSRLPDINSEFIKYRSVALASLASKDYNGMFTALHALDALLPKDYQVRISTREYEGLTKYDVYAECNHCQELDPDDDSEKPVKRATKIKYDELVVREKLLDAFLSDLLETDFVKVWQCPNCKRDNILTKTRFSQKVRRKPYYLQVVPEPPERKDGIMDNRKYHKKIAQWAGNFIAELAHQESRFREEYKGDDSEGEEIGIGTTGDEELD